MSSWPPTTYKTRNWSDYNRALKQRGSQSIWFDSGVAWEAKPSGHRGRQQAYSDAAIQACLTIKVLFGLPLRQATGFVESLLELTGLDWGAGLQHIVPPPEDVVGCHSIPGLSGVVAPASG